MIRSCLTAAAFVLMVAMPAAAQTSCSPPPPGLDMQTWFNACQPQINYTFQTTNHGLPWESFVPALYQMYLLAGGGGGGGGGGQSAPCSPDGQTYCNASGWQMTCTNGQWLTGAVQC